MELGVLIAQLYVPTIILTCLVLGYVLKKWITDVDNKYIPTILCVFGAFLGGITISWTLESILAGAISGLASTGFHQVFKQLIESDKEVIDVQSREEE